MAARAPIEDVLAAPATGAPLKSDLAFELARLRDPASRPVLEQELQVSTDPLVLQGVTSTLAVAWPARGGQHVLPPRPSADGLVQRTFAYLVHPNDIDGEIDTEEHRGRGDDDKDH